MSRIVRRAALLAALGAGAALTASAQAPAPPPAGPAPVDSGRPGVVPRFDPTSVDRSVQPCQDFYQFACGRWLAKNPLPPDRSRWGRLDELSQRNQLTLRGILEKVAKPDPKRGPIDQKIGDFYASCMDEAAIEAKGLTPLKPDLDRIDALTSKDGIGPLVAHLQAIGVPAPFRFDPLPDIKNSTWMIAAVDPGGTALPDRDYYLKDETRFVDIRKQYPGHVQKMFELLGEPRELAVRHAQTVLEIETALAELQLERVKRRDPSYLYHKMTRKDLAALAPHFDWEGYFQALDAPAFAELNVSWPDFFKRLDELLAGRSLDDWKVYLRWHAAHRAAPFLARAFVEEDFNFFLKVLTGTQELRPRWKRCVEHTDRLLGEALGQRFVEATFGAEGKARVSKLVAALDAALDRDIREVPWMTEPTKKLALEKRAALTNRIGYPEHWRDYTRLRIVPGDAFANYQRASAFEAARKWARIGQKVDPTEWIITPPTVNAGYNPIQNNISFPAGILQPPFFDQTMDDAANFGAIGASIGHELTHGFDDLGRKFKPQGNFGFWWTEADNREFEKRSSCLVDQYSEFTVAGGVHLDGRLTLGENTADQGGVRIALMALEDTLQGKERPLRDGLTPEQRFFLAWGQIWCENMTDQRARARAQTDPHSAGRFRVNGTLSNLPEFQKAYNCAPPSPMVRENACRVW